MNEKMMFRPREVQAALGIKNTKFWELVKIKQIETRKIGSATVVPAESLRKFVDDLPGKTEILLANRRVSRSAKVRVKSHE